MDDDALRSRRYSRRTHTNGSQSQHGGVLFAHRSHIEPGPRGGGGDAAASNLQGGFEAWHAGENLDMLPHPEATDKTHVVVRTPEHPRNGQPTRGGMSFLVGCSPRR